MELSFLLFQKILGMVLMLLIGFAVVKLKLLSSQQSSVLSVLTLYVITPCLQISSLQQEFNREKLTGFLVAFAAVILIHAVFIGLTRLLGDRLHLNCVERACLIYSNGGNLIVPLVTSLLGKDYVFYGIAFISFQQVLNWTHHIRLIQPGAPVNVKKILLNPNIIAIAVGMVLFFCNIRLPAILGDTVDSIASMTGPMAMLMVGMLMAGVDLRSAFLRPRHYLICLGRLVIYPAIFILLLAASGVTRAIPGLRQVLIVTTLAVSAPVAVNVVQMSNLFGTEENARQASAINVMSVLFCVVTMPLMIWIYQLVC